MNNEKVNKIIDVVLKVISLVQIIAQAVKAVFPVDESKTQQSVSSVNLTQEEAHIVKDFLNGDIK